jgi:cytoskeletal protein CcmA (bactofilin family)
MTVEKKTIRSDIPGHHAYLNGAGHSGDDTRRMIVGRDIALKGEITACEHLVIEGAITAASFSARRLDVLEAGLFSGKAEVQQAVIAGRFDGTLIVTGRLIVKSTARITGELSYATLEAEAGSRIEGNLSVLPSPIEIPAALPAPVARTVRGPVSNVEKLFGDRAATIAARETTPEDPRVFRRVKG